MTTCQSDTSRGVISILAPAMLPLLACSLYASTLSAYLLRFWDDNRYVTENPLIREVGLDNLWNMFSQFSFANYSPVLLLSFALDHQVWGLIPFGYHLTSLLLHTLNGALAFGVVYRLVGSRRVAGFAALFFIIHPLQVESVAWVAARKNLLSMALFLLAFLAHIRSSWPTAPTTILPLGWGLFLGAALSKPLVVGAPLLFIAYDRWWAGFGWGRTLKRNWFPLLVAVIVAALTIIAHDRAGGIKSYRGGSPWLTAQIMFLVGWAYLLSLLAPINLNNLYVYDLTIILDNPRVWAGLGFLVGTMLMVAWPFRGKRIVRMSGLWSWVFMLPVANILPIFPHQADRHLYFPLLAAGLLVGAAVDYLWQRPVLRKTHPMLAVLLVVPMIVLGTLTVQRIPVWRDSVTLWRDHLQDYPNSITGNINLAGAFYHLRDYARAEPLYIKLLTLSPDDMRPPYFLARIADANGDYKAAVRYYRQAIALSPLEPILYNNLGYAYMNAHQYKEAVTALDAAISKDPRYLRAFVNKGTALMSLGEFVEARIAFETALRLNPQAAEASSGLCIALSNLDELTIAIEMCRNAVELAPENGLYLGRLAHVLLLDGNPAAALLVAQRAILVAPELSLSYRTLADAHAVVGEGAWAVAYYRIALEIDPTNQDAVAGLARLVTK